MATQIFLILQLKPLWPKFRFISEYESDCCKIVIKFLEQEHIHVQAQGDQFQTVYEEAISAVDKLGLEYACDDEVGLLTTRPDTVGCGMKLVAEIEVRN